MKKLTPFLMLLSLVFFSCETESINSDNLDSELAKGKINQLDLTATINTDNCVANLLPDLPTTTYACADAKPGTTSYFDLSIADGALAGSYAAWCVDVARSLDAGQCFDANVYSSYGVLPLGTVDKPENLDLINWILNQSFVGKLSANNVDSYTLGDVQWAMWELIDNNNCVSCTYLSPYNKVRAQEIVQLALASGEGYQPNAGNLMAVILVPNDGKQVVIIPYVVKCKPVVECETAFARDTNGANCFIDNGFSRWGWSIKISTFGDYTYNIYAGAGQCDISKGALAGTASVSYKANGVVTVTYNINSGFSLDETHTYAGKNMFPTKKGVPTVAPGQYTIQPNLSGEIYVIAHAVVCSN